MPPDFLEAVLRLTPDARPDDVRHWLERHGLTATPIQAGILAAGSGDAFGRAFGCDAAALRGPCRVAVPDPLAAHVRAVEVPAPKHPMSGSPGP